MRKTPTAVSGAEFAAAIKPLLDLLGVTPAEIVDGLTWSVPESGKVSVRFRKPVPDDVSSGTVEPWRVVPSDEGEFAFWVYEVDVAVVGWDWRTAWPDAEVLPAAPVRAGVLSA